MIRRLALRRPFARDDRGLALVEFAIALPVLLTLYLGGWQLSDGMSCKRKVTITARELADLTSQNTGVTSSQEDSIIGAAAKVLYPYDGANATIVVTQLVTDNNGNTTVDWSQADSGHSSAAYTHGTACPSTPATPGGCSLPSTMVSPGTYLILTQVAYNYSPIVLYGMTGPVTLRDQVYMSPRLSNNVIWTAS
jgi:Flp pilus assembly protein TadG